INMAYALASDLRVDIEFVPFDRATLAQQLAADDFDVVMSGLVGTLERSEAMWHTSPYMDVRLAFVVPDYEVRRFRSLETLRTRRGLRIGYVDLSRGFVERLKQRMRHAELVELETNRVFFEARSQDLDALLISAESGAAFTLLYPEYEVVVPAHTEVSLPLFYAIGANDAEMRDFLEHWVDLRKMDGTMEEYYDHWILGKNSNDKGARWCIGRDVLGWLD
ncbi:MAG: transporter substrate-binding domain-containing protein, partial [Planctomycetales bacterium]|nr:transporter substrate-binding domain-containing protein [Planctomycetales bacterium]